MEVRSALVEFSSLYLLVRNGHRSHITQLASVAASEREAATSTEPTIWHSS